MTNKKKICRTGRALSAKYLRITHWNIGGIISDVHGNKLEDSEFLKLIDGEDIIALTETHVGENCASLVGKLLNVILSTQRSNFIKIWKESIIPDDLKCV